MAQCLRRAKLSVIQILESMLPQLAKIETISIPHHECTLPKEGTQGVLIKLKVSFFCGDSDCTQNFLLFCASIVNESTAFFSHGSIWTLEGTLGCELKVNN